MLPFAYALRNLWRRRSRTLLTVVGIGLITVLVILMAGFALGLQETVAKTASPDVVLLTSTDEQHDLVRSAVSLNDARTVATNLPAVAKVGPLRAAAPEIHLASRVGHHVALVRGIETPAFLVHRRVTVVEGREPRGAMEAIVGRLAASRLGLPDDALAPGRTVELEGARWTIVGRFAAPGTVLESEIWCRLSDLMRVGRRVDVSAVAARLEDASQQSRVKSWVVENGVAYKIAFVPETAFYARFQEAMAPMSALAWLMAALVLVGGVFACTNTMFAAVLARTRETGTLRALGFGPWAVGLSLFQESLLLAGIGGLAGFFASGWFTDVPLKFPMGAFYLDLSPSVRAAGVGAALLAGILGGLVPAVRTLRLSLTDALGDRL